MVETRRQFIVIGLALALLVLLPWISAALGSPQLLTIGTRVLIYAMAAASLDLILGFGGMVSFGHAAFFGLGGYVVGILAFQSAEGTPLFGLIPGATAAWITWPAAMVVSAAAAGIVGALSLRTSGVHFIMITLAFAQMLFFLFVSLKVYGGDDGMSFRRRNELPGLDLRDTTAFYYVCLGLLVAFLYLCRRLVRSRFGLVLQGIRQNERRMGALGLAAYRYKLTAFVIAGAGAGLAGALMANFLRFVSPDMLHWTKSGELMVMVILGGVGTLFGPVFGAAALVGLESLLAGWTEHWMFVLGPLLVVIILFAKRGLYGFLAGIGGPKG